jgi:hypothetical protein
MVLWLLGLPLYLIPDRPELHRPVLMAGWLVLAAVAGVQGWREARDPHAFVAITRN